MLQQQEELPEAWNLVEVFVSYKQQKNGMISGKIYRPFMGFNLKLGFPVNFFPFDSGFGGFWSVKKVELVVSSPLPRAIETAKLIWPEKQVPVPR